MRFLLAIDIHEEPEDLLGQAIPWVEAAGGTLDVLYVDEYRYNTYLVSDPAVQAVLDEQWDRIQQDSEQKLHGPRANRTDRDPRATPLRGRSRPSTSRRGVPQLRRGLGGDARAPRTSARAVGISGGTHRTPFGVPRGRTAPRQELGQEPLILVPNLAQ